MKTLLSKVHVVLYAVAGVLLLPLLIFLWGQENTNVQKSRVDTGFIQLEDIRQTDVKRADTPLGMVREYRFVLDTGLIQDSALAFYSSHQYIEVYLDGECVYRLSPSGDISMVSTVGSSWTRIPLTQEDAGKEVLVVFTPVYENYSGRSIQFLLGSSLEIYKAQLRQSLPELIISQVNILAGLAFLIFASHEWIKRRRAGSFFALGLLAISVGLWRCMDTMFSPFFDRGRPVFLFYISVTMLMVVSLALLESSHRRHHSEGTLVWNITCVGVALAFIAQLVLQWLNVMELREMLTVTHIMLVASALVATGEAISSRVRHREDSIYGRDNPIWIIAVGILADFVTFFLQRTSAGLLFTLTAVLCYVVVEGVRAWQEQTRILEEKEIQIVRSRATTMMSQIRSHFVFNILNAISGMCKYNPEKADETVVCFARYLRSNINIMEDDSLITFHTDLRHLEDYIALEQIRFGDKIQLETDITVEQFMLPPLILQPIVENSIKHGLTPKPTGGTITLRTRETDKAIVIVLEDDGVGFAMEELEKRGSVGLRNIRFRLQTMMNGKLDIQSEIGKGTVSTITLPKEKAAVG